MPIARYDLDLYGGDTYEWFFALWADPAKTIPVDLTGATAKAEIRDKAAWTSVMIMTSVIPSAAPHNVVHTTLPATLWTGVHAKPGVWDLEVTFASGIVRTYLMGDVTIQRDVTNAVVVP